MVQGFKGSKNEHAKGKNRAHQQRRSAKRTKKGKRFVAPKKAKAIQHMKTQRMLEKSIKQSLENELASRTEEGPFKVIKVEADKIMATGKLVKHKLKELTAKTRAPKAPVDEEVLKAQEEAQQEGDDGDEDVVDSDDDGDRVSARKDTL
ncbi:hypothetical protein PTSG_05255 [Salpingoeca rosetta]|uniref:Uncharacterized protein n=1 Tax=Salpingoeca rosetta (strain ATCC 50818 / BSB-021) TaxID=946362 RepID=F2U9X3_SALR5|nr:uncharacterized protein PTSG_05255 [Salpingoeca rosetta]EGD73548.1 hypothetical protein PTSG_05255 [Salpingoeca rosetta]|eukprot:XP_004993830.1 hypothetical protein PTSG_05255 [Salpingoeca rosetta]